MAAVKWMEEEEEMNGRKEKHFSDLYLLKSVTNNYVHICVGLVRE